MNNPLNSIKRMYSQLGYYEFCEYMDFDPEYDEYYWNEFQKLCQALGSFDDTRIQKMLDFGKENESISR